MLNRRMFLASGAAAIAAGAANKDTANYPVRRPKEVELLWKSPDGHPNGLEATPEGLWVGEQLTDSAYLLDWKTGKVLRKVETISSNTSGIAYGGGYLWMAANGKPLRRPANPEYWEKGRVVKIDAKTGKTVAQFKVPGNSGIHGLEWVDGTLWLTQFTPEKQLVQVDADFKILKTVPCALGRAHGLAWDNGAIWCLYSNDWVMHKIDVKDGRVLEAIQLDKNKHPDPHGMDMYKGVFYYCDAGIAPGATDTNSKFSGYIVRLRF